MSSEDLTRLKRNLKTAREAVRVTQTEAGRAVGKSRQTIVNWESPANPAEPSTAELATLAALYRVEPRDLRFGHLERGPAVARTSPPPEEAPTIPVEAFEEMPPTPYAPTKKPS